jgi:hypothetical protein
MMASHALVHAATVSAAAAAAATATAPTPVHHNPTSMRMAAAVNSLAKVGNLGIPNPRATAAAAAATSTTVATTSAGGVGAGVGLGGATRPVKTALSLSPNGNATMPRVEALRNSSGVRKAPATAIITALDPASLYMAATHTMPITFNPYAGHRTLHPPVVMDPYSYPGGTSFHHNGYSYSAYRHGSTGHSALAQARLAAAPATIVMTPPTDATNAFPEFFARFFSRDFSCDVVLALRPIPRA